LSLSVVTTPDRKAFFLLWAPPGKKLSEVPVIVSLHGHASWAYDDLYIWQPYAARYGYGVLALQWWFGGGEGPEDYYRPEEIYRVLDVALAREGVRPGRALLQGFSRGATQVYALTALDRTKGPGYFALSVANAGGAAADFPANDLLNRGVFGRTPLAGSNWALFCGGKDPNPERDGCPAMARARTWVQKLGGSVPLFIQDPKAGHGGFHRTPVHVDSALNLFGRLLK
jgi:hypothetical protein